VQASSGTSFPILQKVLVSFGDDIAFEDTLDAALDSLFGGNSGASAGDGGVVPGETGSDGADGETPVDGGSGDGTDGGTDTGSSGGQSAELRNALRDMRQALADRDAAMQEGDWTAFGEADARLRDAIDRAMAAQ
jgi:uncharacterized membrane protein (UPF0182 family)